MGRDDLVEIRVADTGLGIEPKYLDTIFEEFVTIDTGFARETSGTGLGLAITKRLVQAMGGDISADSIPGEGSFFLPYFCRFRHRHPENCRWNNMPPLTCLHFLQG